MAIFIKDLFDFFWLYTVPGNVLNVVVIPLRLQLPELHRLKLAQGNAGFEALTTEVSDSRWKRALVEANDVMKPRAIVKHFQRFSRPDALRLRA